MAEEIENREQRLENRERRANGTQTILQTQLSAAATLCEGKKIMKIVKDGYMLIFAALFFGVVFILLGRYSAIFYAFAFVMLLKAALFAYFFRDPARNIIINENTVLSPADGTVLDIIQTNDEKTIRIFLSVFNVHIQRAPISGQVSIIERRRGKFLPAMKPDAYKLNEQNIFTIKNFQGESFKVYQIVGILARRLVSWISVNQEIKQGEKIGIIKFGSQVDISIPSHYTIKVNAGQKVFAGITKIAEK